MSEEKQTSWIAGFWSRIGALLIDAVLLGVVGFILGLFLEPLFVRLGDWGRFVGFVIALGYFGVMNSVLGGSQTIGKRLFELKVVDVNNQPITLGRSLLRYMVLAVPLSFNGIHLSNEALHSFLIYPLALVIVGGLFSTMYLYIFNRATRQSLHDLAVETYVVNANVDKQEVGKVWRGHLFVIAFLCVVSLIAPLLLNPFVKEEPFKGLLEAQAALSNEPGVIYSAISSGTTTHSTNEGSKTTSYIVAQAFLAVNSVKDKELARHLAVVTAKNYPDAASKDIVRVSLTYGYTIGIWSSWTSYVHDFAPGELD